MSRSKNLTERDIENVVRILDGWVGKLSWELLVGAIAKRSRSTYTRQALSNHKRIKDAFVLRKSKLKLDSKSTAVKISSVEVEVLLARLARITGENQRLQMENNRLLEKFATWGYNAHCRGLNEDFLSQPLPAINRSVTRI